MRIHNSTYIYSLYGTVRTLHICMLLMVRYGRNEHSILKSSRAGNRLLLLFLKNCEVNTGIHRLLRNLFDGPSITTDFQLPFVMRDLQQIEYKIACDEPTSYFDVEPCTAGILVEKDMMDLLLSNCYSSLCSIICFEGNTRGTLNQILPFAIPIPSPSQTL